MLIYGHIFKVVWNENVKNIIPNIDFILNLQHFILLKKKKKKKNKKKNKTKQNKKQRKQKNKNKNITKQNKNLQHFINSLPTTTNSWNFPKTKFLKIKFKFKFVIKFIHFKYTFGSAVSTSTIPFFLMNLLGYYYPFVVKGLWVLINSTSKVSDSWIRD